MSNSAWKVSWGNSWGAAWGDVSVPVTTFSCSWVNWGQSWGQAWCVDSDAVTCSWVNWGQSWGQAWCELGAHAVVTCSWVHWGDSWAQAWCRVGEEVVTPPSVGVLPPVEGSGQGKTSVDVVRYISTKEERPRKRKILRLPVVGEADASLPLLTARAIGLHGARGAASALLPGVDASATVGVSAPAEIEVAVAAVKGQAAALLQGPSVHASGKTAATGRAAAAIPLVAARAEGRYDEFSDEQLCEIVLALAA